MGKYRGMTFEEVQALDPDYCEWVERKAQEGSLGNFAEWLAAHPTENLKTYIDVPFQRKEFAKQLGAKWDGDKKKWFAPASSREQLLAAFPPVGAF